MSHTKYEHNKSIIITLSIACTTLNHHHNLHKCYEETCVCVCVVYLGCLIFHTHSNTLKHTQIHTHSLTHTEIRKQACMRKTLKSVTLAFCDWHLS